MSLFLGILYNFMNHELNVAQMRAFMPHFLKLYCIPILQIFNTFDQHISIYFLMRANLIHWLDDL